MSKSLRGLHAVQRIRLSPDVFKNAKPKSHRAFYSFLLSICEVIFGSLLVEESSGETKFRDFTRDPAKMAFLFQAFIFNFIARECQQWDVKSENIAWKATSETDLELKLLPRMTTDISVRRGSQYRIIDAKFYSSTLASYFDAEKIYNANLYQMLSYILNADGNSAAAEGMLIYPKIDRHLREVYEILGRKIFVYTLDINAPWRAIDQELREIMR